MNNFLLFIAALLVLALSALFAAPYFIDWNDHRTVFEQQASRLIGRNIKADGNISLTLLPTPVLQFENISIADADKQFDTPFLSARSLTVSLSVPPLLRGIIEARDVKLDHPVLHLRIDAEGKGNWQGVGHPDASLPFLPHSVALVSLTISDGKMTFAHEEAEPVLTVDRLDGVLSAASLMGPYKFAGSLEVQEKKQQLRFSTSAVDANGSVNLKAVLKDDGTRAVYFLDGGLSGFSSTPTFSGQFRAVFPEGDAQVFSSEISQDGVKPDTIRDSADAPVQVKANIAAGVSRAELRDLEITLRQGNKPQTVRGQLDLEYKKGMTIEGALASRWVDLDSIAEAAASGATASADPAQISGKVAGQLLGWSKLVGASRLRLAFEQAVLAGDLLQDVRADLIGESTKITIPNFTAKLPGENSLMLQGILSGEETQPVFTGKLSLEGNKLNRLLGWGGLEAQPVVAGQDGSFSVMGRLTVGPHKVALQQVTGQMLGSHFSGAISRTKGDPGELVLVLKSDRLDISRLAGPQMETVSLPGILRLFGSGDPRSGKTDQTSWFGGGEARIDVDVGEITLPGLGTSAIEAGMYISGSDIDIRRLILRSDKGLKVQANGTLSGLEAKPKGNLTLEAQADGPQGVTALGVLLELDTFLAGEDERLKLLAPASFTASLSSHTEGGAGLQGRMEGNLGGSDVALDFVLDGAPSKWMQTQLNASLKVNNKNGKTLLRQLFPHLKVTDFAGFTSKPGMLEFTVKGRADPGLDTEMILKSAGLDWRAAGKTRVISNELAFTGNMRSQLPDSAFLIRFAGGDMAPGRQPLPTALTVHVTASKDIYELTDISLRAGGETYKGKGKIDLSKERPHVGFDIDASAAALPVLLEPLVNWGTVGSGGAGVRGVTGTKSHWPEAAIDTGLLQAFDGSLKLRSRKLRLSGGLALDQGILESELKAGVLNITKLEGRLLGGQLSAHAAFSAQGNGIQFKASGTAKGIRLEKLVKDGRRKSVSRGSVDLKATLQGGGLSPHGVAAGLNGSGEVSFSKGAIQRLSPSVPQAVITELNRGNQAGSLNEKELLAAIGRLMKKSQFTFRPFVASIDIRNGVARVEKAILDSREGQATVSTFLELTSLRLDSEWVLSTKAGRDRAGKGDDIPKLSLVFTGSLPELGTLKPTINAQALRRYVTIQRMERDVERLEKLEVPKPEKVPVPKRKVQTKRKILPAPQSQPTAPAVPVPVSPEPGQARTPPQLLPSAPPPVPPPSRQTETRPLFPKQKPPPPLPTPGPDTVISRPLPSVTISPSPLPPASVPQSLPWLAPSVHPGPVQPALPGASSPDVTAPVVTAPIQPIPRPVPPRERDSFRDLDVLRSGGD